MRLVFFDFDKTLTKIDTVLLFGFYIGIKRRKYSKIVSMCADALMAKFNFLSNQEFKERFAWLFLAGERLDEITIVCNNFYDKYSDRLMKRNILQVLDGHRTKGDRVWIVSANYDCFLEPLRRKFAIEGILASQTEIIHDRLTGNLLGKVCHGREKVARVKERFGEEAVSGAVAYGDSKSDLYLLRAVKEGCLVTKQKLRYL